MIFKTFTKKNSLLLLTISICTIIFITITSILSDIYFFNYEEEPVAAVASINQGGNFFIDLNGDGKKDIIYISSSSNQYTISCNINNKNYPLEVKSPLNTLGAFDECWPISINFIDLSRDKVPELILQSSENNVPILHIFKWTGEGFKDIYCSTNSIFGVLDSNNSKTPKIISYSLEDSIDAIQKHMVINNNTKNISYDNGEIPAYDSIKEFIRILTEPNNLYNLPDIFADTIPYELIHQLDVLNKKDFQYVFQDGFFRDTVWDSKGNIVEVNWKLRFKKYSKNNKENFQLLERKLNLRNINGRFMINDLQ